MNQTSLMGARANDVSNDTSPAAIGAAEIRALTDLELTSAGGGDTVIIWTPPSP